MRRPGWFVLLFPLFTLTSRAQEAPSDSLASYEMEPLVVTATRTPKELANVPLPTTIVSAQDLRTRGALRLTDALAELTGLSLHYDHGAGIQVQGFDADYTLILIDGEPVIGRTAGTLDLERLSVSGIERIEIVQGPSSSLYGSEALAGVINIITRKAAERFATQVRSRYGTHQTANVAATLEATGNRAGVKALVDRYSSSGYDLTPDTYGPTTPQFIDYTADIRAHLQIDENTRFNLGARLALQDQHAVFSLDETGVEIPYRQTEDQRDWSLHPEIRRRLSRRIEAIGSIYIAQYSNKTEQVSVADDSPLYYDRIEQAYRNAELQINAYWNARHLTVLGAGLVRESLDGARYGTVRPEAGSQFVYAQHEWFPTPFLDVNLSTRFDTHEAYAACFSPKLSALLRLDDAVRVRFSVGSGFKAPAFRQLYLNFTNAAAGYTVLGSNQVKAGLARLERDGMLAATFIQSDPLGEIEAERSLAINAGISADLTPRLDLSLGLFHNNVRDLIETQPIAQKMNGSFVYSYFNLNRIYTRGANFELNAHPLRWLQTAFGYQFLQARDHEVVDAIRAGRVFGRTLGGSDYRLALSDYEGLLGRSPHSGTARVVLTDAARRITGSVRAVWRNRYGYRDLDGNAIANLDEEFVPGYMLWHATMTASWPLGSGTSLTAQLGVNNLLDVTRPNRAPSLPGRTLYTSLELSF